MYIFSSYNLSSYSITLIWTIVVLNLVELRIIISGFSVNKNKIKSWKRRWEKSVNLIKTASFLGILIFFSLFLKCFREEIKHEIYLNKHWWFVIFRPLWIFLRKNTISFYASHYQISKMCVWVSERNFFKTFK